MDLPFAYDKVATGKQFICRKKETEQFLRTIIDTPKGVAIYGAPKSGVESLTHRGLMMLKEKRYNFTLCEIDLFNVRSYRQFMELFGRKMLQCAKEACKNSMFPPDFQLDKMGDDTLLNLADIIAKDSNTTILVYFKEFQNILSWENSEECLELFEKRWSKHLRVKYILTGSFINMMKYIFEEKKYFFYTTETITLSPIPRKNAVDYIVSTFLNTGRVIEDAEAGAIYDMMRGNMWYIKHFCSICLSLPIGYVNSGVIEEAKEIIISLHSPRFMQIISDLTDNQINFIKAVLDEVTRFSSSEILEKYKLNSSANVFRVKDALKKKEVIAFDSGESAYIIDPLFHYWLKNYYFEQ